MLLSSGCGLLSFMPDLAESAIRLLLPILKVDRAAALKLLGTIAPSSKFLLYSCGLATFAVKSFFLLKSFCSNCPGLFCLNFSFYDVNSLASISEAEVSGAVPQIRPDFIRRHFSFLESPHVPVECTPLGGWSVEGFSWNRFSPRLLLPFILAHRPLLYGLHSLRR